jgi:carbon monoxide dehydrogenase subunit G
MTLVTASIDIDAPREKVFETMLDPARLKEWVTIHRKVNDVDGGRPHEGYAMEQTLCLRGVNFKVHWELVRCEHPFHAEWHGRGPARSHAETEYRLSGNGRGGTRFDYRNEFRAPLGPLGAVASRAIVGGLPQREAVASLQRLKALAERNGR